MQWKCVLLGLEARTIRHTMSFAGYSASEATWNAFSADWRTVLNESPKLDYFKMSEAESRKGQFLGFTPEQRDARLGDFIDVILTHFAVGSERRRAIEALPRSPAPHPSQAAREPVLLQLHRNGDGAWGFYRHSGSQEMVDFIFDEQQGKELTMRRLYHQFRGWYPNWQLGRVAFKSDKDFLPIQGADLIAWQTRRFMYSTEGTRKELKRLHSARPAFRSILKRRDLQNMAEAIKNNLVKLREDYGDKVDQHLAAIAKYHGRESYSLDN